MPPAPRYIVIGAGPAGCALAAALAEEQDGGVVLLEMGADLVGLSCILRGVVVVWPCIMASHGPLLANDSGTGTRWTRRATGSRLPSPPATARSTGRRRTPTCRQARERWDGRGPPSRFGFPVEGDHSRRASQSTRRSLYACCALQGRVFLTPRGKGPGGTGLVNAMQYSRGYRTDYDGWPWPLEAIERSARIATDTAHRHFFSPPHPPCITLFLHQTTPPMQELRPRRAPAPRGGGADAGGPVPGGGRVRAGGGGGPSRADGRRGARPPAAAATATAQQQRWEGAGSVVVVVVLPLLPDPGVVRPHVLRGAAPAAPPDLHADAHEGLAVRGVDRIGCMQRA